MRCKAFSERYEEGIRCEKDEGHSGWHDSKFYGWTDWADNCTSHEEVVLNEYSDWLQYRETLYAM